MTEILPGPRLLGLCSAVFGFLSNIVANSALCDRRRQEKLYVKSYSDCSLFVAIYTVHGARKCDPGRQRENVR